MARHAAVYVILTLGLASIGAAQSCNDTPLHGAPISGANLDPNTAVGTVSFQTEGLTGTFTCPMSVLASRGQHYLILRYQESWFYPDPRFITCGGDYCKNTIVLTVSGPGISDTVTLSSDGTTRPPPDSGPVWILIGGSTFGESEHWERTVSRTIDISAATRSADATFQFQLTDTAPGYEGSVTGTFTVGRLMSLIDPVDELLTGNQILTDPEALATLGTLVSGVAADAASRVLVRIQAQLPGQTVTLNILNDQGGASSDPTKDGSVAAISGTPTSGPLQLTAVSTNEGPMAFALYLPPANFSRGGTDDNAKNRMVTLQWSLGNAPGIVLPPTTESVPITVWRPPVVLVHGLWGSSDDWFFFTPFVTDSRFFSAAADYNLSTGFISASDPTYSANVLSGVSTNALGFAFNAPTVLAEIQQTIVDFRQGLHVAATQADVIAHSMGGTITRTLEYLPVFTDRSSFGIGGVHKLITIGTPHLGSPLALQLLQGNNACTRNILAERGGKVSLSTATVAGVPGVSGGVGDLQGDGFGGSMSPALNAIQGSNGHEVPTALIAGTMTQNNLDGLSCMFCAASFIRLKCGSDYLGGHLNSAVWPAVFFGSASDAIVPLSSQLNGNLSGVQVNGVIHSAGVEGLSFTGPAELDPLGTVNTIQTTVIQLLNASAQSSSFHKLP